MSTQAMIDFKTHAGEIVCGERLKAALAAVADREVERAYAVHHEDLYAPHVTADKKADLLAKRLEYAEAVRCGAVRPSFALWQRINTRLTGECVGFLGGKQP